MSGGKLLTSEDELLFRFHFLQWPQQKPKPAQLAETCLPRWAVRSRLVLDMDR